MIFIKNSICNFYHLSGDPAVFGNLDPHPAVNEAVRAVLDSSEVNTNGYPHSSGLLVARKAIAEKLSTDKYKLTPEVRKLHCAECLNYPRYRNCMTLLV